MLKWKLRTHRWRRPTLREPSINGLSPLVRFLCHSPWNERETLLSGKFTFLNESRELLWPPDWNAPGTALLWQFHLHYFQYLPLLTASEQEELCLHWIESSPEGSGPGWHPYPTSLRIVNWCKAGIANSEVAKSLSNQCRFLACHLEFYHPGNHYLENAKALIFGGIYFGEQGEAAEWVRKGKRILATELKEQVLPDGSYFERTPMYHALMVELVLDLLNIYPHSDNFRSELTEYATRMLPYLAAVTHPDGTLALLNDSTEEIAPSTSDLLEYASKLGVISKAKSCFVDSGLYVSQFGGSCLIADFGPVGPDYLPAHAHADIFTYELSVLGKRVVVDTGVYEYATGERRRLSRSTQSHNCPVVDGVDQAECWASFRMARRYPPRDVHCRDDGEVFSLEGKFEGYRYLIGDEIVVTRRVRRGPGCQLSIVDKFEGHGVHEISTRIHLHPAVTAQREGAGFITLDGDVTVTSQEEIDIEASQYFSRFGLSQARSVLVLKKKGTLPAELAYLITWEEE